VTTQAAAPSGLSGQRLRDTFATAATWLERNASAVNAINVFPVPDGDTGTNMALTLRAAVEESMRAGASVPDVVRALARGALMGARGNSGVILSQYLRGIADRLGGEEEVGGVALAEALAAGAHVARAAVQNPTEGTILTVAREAGEAAANAPAEDPVAVLDAAVRGAKESVARTPDLLPVLREAGVVDSGGLGLSVLLEGALWHLRGEPLPAAAEDSGAIAAGWLEARSGAHDGKGSAFGYCVEFVIRVAAAGDDGLREALAGLGDSVLVVGDEDMVHVHVHTDDPGAALSLGAGRGRLRGVKIEDMDEQAATLAGRSRPAVPSGPFSVVAVAAGDGLAEALRGAGAEQVIAGGQSMNPSTRDILDAIESASLASVVVLPNNKNIIWTAEQAAQLSGKSVEVVATRSIPQGIAALLALNPEEEPASALEGMRSAAAAVHTVEVTRAARSARINDVQVREGEPIALIDDELTASAATAEAAAIAALTQLGPGDAPLITVYYGASGDAVTASGFAADLRRRYPEAEVELVNGGQPFYDYIISVE
jgi:uncharacterized protein